MCGAQNCCKTMDEQRTRSTLLIFTDPKLDRVPYGRQSTPAVSYGAVALQIIKKITQAPLCLGANHVSAIKINTSQFSRTSTDSTFLRQKKIEHAIFNSNCRMI